MSVFAIRPPDAIGLGRPHFRIQIGEVSLVYCYIRKNACSAFKRLFAECSPHRSERSSDEDDYNFMRRFHKLKRNKPFDARDRSVFVYRDPLERSASLFKNKFVQRTGHEALFDNYRKVTGKHPEDATFAEFVETYLRPTFRDLDPHTIPQADHLRPDSAYTDPIRLDQVHVRMAAIVGDRIADAIFRVPMNPTANLPVVHQADAASRPAEELRIAYLERNAMPPSSAFLTDDLRLRLTALYARDLAMLDQLEPPAHCAAPMLVR